MNLKVSYNLVTVSIVLLSIIEKVEILVFFLG